MPLSLIQPPGARSLRGDDAVRVLAAQHWVAQWFRVLGGDPVIPSTLVSYSGDEDWLGQKGAERIRLIDRSTGDVVSLRADLTTQILHQESLENPRSLFAVGPVFRETVTRPDQPRENWQATLEHLRVDLWPQGMLDPFGLIVAGAAEVARYWLDERWCILIGNAEELPTGQGEDRYLQPQSVDKDWYRLPVWQGDDADAVCDLAGLSDNRPRLNQVLAPPRGYYAGQYFQLFHPDSNRPIVAGGLYRRGRNNGVHAGFGVDLEALALEAADKVPMAVERSGCVVPPDNLSGDLLRHLWHNGITLGFDAATSIKGSGPWDCRRGDKKTSLGDNVQDVVRNLLSILREGA